MATRALPFVEPQAGQPDPVSIVLNCAAFGSVIAGTNALAAAPLMAAGIFAFGILTFAVLVMRERPKTRPLIPIDLLRSASFAVSIIASICCFTGQTAGLVSLPFFLQHELQQTPAAAALYMVVWPLGVAVTAPLAGHLVRHVPAGRICAIGAALLATGLAAIALSPLKDDPLLLLPLLTMCGAGFGLFQVANNRNMFLSAPPARSAASGGMQGTARLTGQTAGTLLVAQLYVLMPVYAVPQIAIGFGAAFTLTAGLISLFRTTRP
jgi:DHA2 family multidrug resistance protein-like MFS transporter